MNLFFENSTRTRTTFEAAAKRLSANVLNIDIARSSTSKGETLRDTLWNLEAMAADLLLYAIHLQVLHILLQKMCARISGSLTREMDVTPIPLRLCWICLRSVVKLPGHLKS